MDEESRAWKDLIQSEGWQRLRARVVEQWSAEHVEQMAAKAVEYGDDVAGLGRLRQILAAKRAVQQVLGYPEERLAALERSPVPEVERMNRRGAL